MPELPRDNPFSGVVVADGRQRLDSDVPEINRQAFEACLAAVQLARQNRESASVLLYGEPGSGKTHLMARLRAELELASCRHHESLSVVVSIKLNAGPRRLWRHIREQLAEDLKRDIGGRTTLDRLVAVRLSSMDHLRNSPALWFEWLRQPQKDVEGIQAFLDETVQDRNLTIVLTHLFLGRHKLDARAWLRGDSLPEEALARLGVAGDDPEPDQDPETRARKTIQALCRLGAPAPFVFCFDQIEALQNGAQDFESLFAFGRMAAELHDGSPNVALISCIQSAFRDTLKQSIREADWHRLQKMAGKLDLLKWPQARAVILKRLETQPALVEMRKHRGGLWPLQEQEIITLMTPSGCTARALISHCRELYERAREVSQTADADESLPATVPNPAESMDAFLENTWSRRFEAALRTVTSSTADDILESGLPQAFRILAPGWNESQTERVADVDMMLDGALTQPGNRLAISLCNHGNMRSLAGRLRRLNESLQTGRMKGRKLVLIRRAPISPSAKKAREYLNALTEKGVALIQPSPEAMAALAALRDVLADAQSGDLSHGGQTLKPESIREWLGGHMPQAVKDLVGGLLTPSPEPDLNLKQDLLDWLNARHIARLEEAAAALKQESAAVRACILRNPAFFGLLDGPPPVVFQRTSETVEE